MLADTELPFWFVFWFPLSNAILTLIVAGGTVYFARTQSRLNEAQLRTALFDRRVAVYDAMRSFVADIMISGTTERELLIKMLRETKHVEFLFKPRDDIAGFISHFYEQGVDLQYAQKMHRAIRNAQEEPERLRLIQREHDLLMWFKDQNTVIADKFRPYLQLWYH
jgi:hypothetical protein